MTYELLLLTAVACAVLLFTVDPLGHLVYSLQEIPAFTPEGPAPKWIDSDGFILRK